MITGHRCPGGCGNTVPFHQFACKPDWFRLPMPLRDEITGAFRVRLTDPARHSRALTDAARWFRANARVRR